MHAVFSFTQVLYTVEQPVVSTQVAWAKGGQSTKVTWFSKDVFVFLLLSKEYAICEQWSLIPTYMNKLAVAIARYISYSHLGR